MNKLLILLSVFLYIALSGCGKPGTTSSSRRNTNQGTYTVVASAPPTTIPAIHTLTVFAAASLTGAFQEIGKDFETANPGVNVSFNFAGSQILSTQLEQGASADVFASADLMNMDLLVTDNLVATHTYQDFTTNQLIVILPPSNPANLQTLTDLANPNLKLVLADSSVPAGKYARQVLSNMSKDPIYGPDYSAKVLTNLVSNETDVKQVVTKVELGEADAGLVYISDAIAAPDLITVTIPDKFNIIARYPIAILTSAPEPKHAKAFVTYVISPPGQAILIKWGFTPITH
ncbi:MAG: molybdate ABC transporter substrate-binding protein [Anaerolineales bacterium]